MHSFVRGTKLYMTAQFIPDEPHSGCVACGACSVQGSDIFHAGKLCFSVQRSISIFTAPTKILGKHIWWGNQPSCFETQLEDARRVVHVQGTLTRVLIVLPWMEHPSGKTDRRRLYMTIVVLCACICEWGGALLY